MRRVLGTIAVVATLGAVVVVPAASARVAGRYIVHSQSEVSTNVVAAMPLVRLRLDHAVSVSQLPRLATSPHLITEWKQVGAREVEAVVKSRPSTSVVYTIDLPTAFTCVRSCAVRKSHVVTTSLHGGTIWVEQLLAKLNYLPVAFTPLVTATGATEVPGYFTWRFPHLPASLTSQWSPGIPGVILQGALMSFQNAHGLPTDGDLTPATWSALLVAAAHHQVSPVPYNYVDVQESSPESLVLYINGVARFKTLVNTGVSAAPTALGTFPVYLRFTSQTMSGTEPDGTHYSDPGIPWISYFNGGDALHGFIRSSYGWPQSLGCVEMPFASAATVWPHTPIGTLVTVRA